LPCTAKRLPHEDFDKPYLTKKQRKAVEGGGRLLAGILRSYFPQDHAAVVDQLASDIVAYRANQSTSATMPATNLMPRNETTDHFRSDSMVMPVQWRPSNTNYQNLHPQAQADLVGGTPQAIQVLNVQMTRWERPGVNPHFLSGPQ